MKLRKSIVRGGATLLIGHAASHVLVFVRNLLIARLIDPEHFGIGATFAITLSLLEMISDLAADKLLIQAKDGDQPRLQATAQALQAVRGVLTATVIFLIAGPVALLFDVPEATWAFRWLAVVPLIRGMLHLDYKRFHRELNYRPTIIVEVSAQAFALAMVWPLVNWRADYSVVLWVTVAQVLAMLLASHLVAQRRYCWAWEAGLVKRFIAFGWPLLLNGLLMFGIFQGDRVIVGAHYTMAALGAYAVAFGLAMAPTMMLARVNAAVFLPALSQCQDDPALFASRYRRAALALSLAAGLLAGGFILAGPAAIVLLYGAEYAAAGSVIGWLGAMQAVRLLRAAPSQAAMALGETRNMMIANVARSTALAGMLAAAVAQAPLWWIAACGLGGELLAAVTALGLLKRQHRVAWGHTLGPASIGAVMVLMAVLMAMIESDVWVRVGLYGAILLLSIGAVAWHWRQQGLARRLALGS